MSTVRDLKHDKRNARKHNDRNLGMIQKSIEEVGTGRSIVIDEENNILAGNGTVQSFSKAGKTKVKIIDVDGDTLVAVRRSGLTAEQKQKLALYDNRTAELADWDVDVLKGLNSEMDLTGMFTEKELLKIGFDPTEVIEDEVPEAPKKPRSKTGDLYELGNHRVLCGDSLDREAVEKLMNGKRSRMIFTDPPYNVDYGANKLRPSWNVRAIKNDKLGKDQWEVFCKTLFEVFKEFNEADVYMWGASGPEGMKMRLWLTETGCHWSATIIWKKNQMVLSPAKYQRIYEPCFYGWFGSSSFCADRKQVEVWDFNRPRVSADHPTMKPLELCAYGIKNSSQPGDIVMDLLLGSGSTLIACDQIGRKCYGMELDPKYVDVIVSRYVRLTGGKVKLNGKPIEWKV